MSFSETKETGLVKKLFFPAFADAGSNENFFAAKADGGGETASTVASEASTAVRDNRTPAGSGNGSARRNGGSTRQPQRNPPPPAAAAAQQPPPFFASTKPRSSGARNSVGTVAAAAAAVVDPPASPPKLSRLMPAKRSLSTLAVIEDDGTAARHATIAATEESATTGSAETERKKKDASSPSSRAYAASAGDDEKEEEEEGRMRELTDDRDAETPVISNTPTAPSTCSESSGAVERARDLLNRVRESPAGAADGGPWEEGEVSPSSQQQQQQQTTALFGKELLFQRALGQQTDGDEILSTASEMGTVVGGAERLASLEGMESTVDETDQQQSPKGPDDWDGPGGLSIPILEKKEAPEEEKKIVDHDSTTTVGEERTNEEKASSILSKAIRRLRSSSSSAPTTPRQQQTTYFAEREQQVPQHSPAPARTSLPFLMPSPRQQSDETPPPPPPPSSFLLRSPGSTAFVAAHSSTKKKKESILSPRYTTSWQQRDSSSTRNRHRTPHFDRIPEAEAPSSDSLQKAAQAFQIARSCFSFDAFDTSMDDQVEFQFPGAYPPSLQDAQNMLAVSHQKNLAWLDSPDRQNSDVLLHGSASWDVGGAPSRTPAFRGTPSRIRGRAVPLNHQSAFDSPPDRLRSKIPNDTSPSLSTSVDLLNLKTPQRIEIEREDALDILACLVERGVSWKHSTTKEEDEGKPAADRDEVNEGRPDNDTGRCPTPSVADVTATLEELGRISVDEEKADDSEARRKRKLVLEELQRAHEYALEMKRASQSASSWLQSIGRSQSTNWTSLDDKLKSDISPGPEKESRDSVPTESAAEGIDLLTAKAMLHSAQMEAKEKSELADRLNEELAKCRAEIGRLKTASRAPVFRSPNRSILDESDDISITEADEEDEENEVNRSFLSEGDVLDSSFLREGEASQPVKDESEIEKFRLALEEANQMIRKLHGELKGSGSGGDEFSDEAPVVEVPSEKRAAQSESPGNKDQRAVNVRMLDGENFVTEWDDLVPPLPRPPDHDLRSPIVAAVLEQWTSESTLHESLISWIENILAGRDPDSVPPLTLSSLDHQVRDGFILHVLPLLLRRADIRVDVKTRAQRRTSYDLAVSVEMTDPGVHFSEHVRRHLETTSARSDVGADSTVHSSATTALISNGTHRLGIPAASSFTDEGDRGRVISSRLSYDEIAEDVMGLDDQQPGIISALGGALGGFLARRPREATSHVGLHESNMQTILESPKANGFAPSLEVPEEGEQPYHRVVSAPPGRIGVTFVEYRGHCMVSDVAADSPLGGWIFPSDVLIAIDELTVSGMRVRDIIKVLKDRKDRQRALRVISSHAMSEFTLNTSVTTDATS